jgi:hypothetical protein
VGRRRLEGLSALHVEELQRLAKRFRPMSGELGTPYER